MTAGLAVPTVVAGTSLLLWLATLVRHRSRGLDPSDEAYYLVSALHPERNLATNSDFGFYLRPLLELGGSIGGLRMLGLTLLVVSATLVARAATAWAPADLAPPLLVFAGVWTSVTLATLMYYGLWLPTPSYNLMTAAFTMFAAAAFLAAVRRGRQRDETDSRVEPAAVALGAALTFGALNKPTAFIAIAMITLASLALLVGRRTAPRSVVSAVGGAVAALPLHWLLIGFAPIEDVRRLLRGVRFFSLLGSHERARMLETEFLTDDVVPWLAYLAVLGIAATSLLRGRRHPRAFVLAGAVGVATFTPLALDLPPGGVAMLASDAGWWWLRVGSLALVWITAFARDRTSLLVLGPTVFLLAPASGLGSNNGFIHQASLTPGPVVAAIVIQVLVVTAGTVGPRRIVTLSVSAVPLLLVAIATFGWRGEALQSPYRLAGPVGESTTQIRLGGLGTVRVDAASAEYVAALQSVAESVDPAARSCVVNLTGAAPLATLALDGKPAAHAWLPGGYPGSLEAADFVLEHAGCLDGPSLLIESVEGPRAIERPPALDGLDYREIMRLEFSAYVEQVQVVSVSSGR